MLDGEIPKPKLKPGSQLSAAPTAHADLETFPYCKWVSLQAFTQFLIPYRERSLGKEGQPHLQHSSEAVLYLHLFIPSFGINCFGDLSNPNGQRSLNNLTFHFFTVTQSSPSQLLISVKSTSSNKACFISPTLHVLIPNYLSASLITLHSDAFLSCVQACTRNTAVVYHGLWWVSILQLVQGKANAVSVWKYYRDLRNGEVV